MMVKVTGWSMARMGRASDWDFVDVSGCFSAYGGVGSDLSEAFGCFFLFGAWRCLLDLKIISSDCMCVVW